MTKAALREKRRQERIARRNRNRLIAGIVGIVIVAFLAFMVINEQFNKPDATDEIASPFTLSDAAVTTSSGLIYEDLTVGEGPAAQAGDTVSVTYTGYLTDGTVFDSNEESGQPFEFQLGSGYVIPGWDEGLVGMQTGGNRLLVIPSTLAYGPSGSSGVIPPNATLTFSVTLLEIK
jgi:FKBP-type peptidyl-prolyl cis-trans isomerase FkpA